MNALERASEPDGLISRHLVERSVAHKGSDIPDPVQSAIITRALVEVIEGRGWSGGHELRELWAHSNLFYFLACRDVKVHYQQTVPGAAWAILQPMISILVFTILFFDVSRGFFRQRHNILACLIRADGWFLTGLQIDRR